MAQENIAASNESTPASNSVGKVMIVYGNVQAINESGMTRTLSPGSPVFQGERIVTGPDGSVGIVFNDGQSQLELGRLSDVQIDSDVYSQLDPSEVLDAASDIAAIQQALIENNFDPTVDLTPTAAGNNTATDTSPAGGGRTTVEFTPDGLEVTPDSGAETIGLTRDFLAPPPVNIVEEEGDTTTTTTVAAAATPSSTDPAPTPPPTPSISMTDPNEVITVSEVARLMGTEAQTVSGNLLDNVSNATTPVISQFTIENANGDDQTYTVSSGSTVTVDVYQDGLKTGTLTIGSDGSFTYILDNHANHNIPESYGASDAITLPSVTYLITDTTTGLTDTSTLTIIIEDGEPTVEVLQDAILSNEAGNSVVGQIEADYGADGKATLVEDMQLLDADGNSLIGQTVVDVNGNPITANGGESLIYIDNGEGGVIAVIDDGTATGGGTVFEVSLTPPADGETNATYTVTLDDTNTLDNQTTSQTTTESVSLTSTTADNDTSLSFTSGDLVITATGLDNTGQTADVYVDSNGLGVEGGGLIGTDNTNVNLDETLTLTFTDSNGDSTGLDNVEFTVTGINGTSSIGNIYYGDSVEWTAYTVDSSGNTVVASTGNYASTATDSDTLTFEVEGDNITELVITTTTSKGSEFQVSSVVGDQTTEETIDEQSVSYTVEVTDSDESGGVSTGDQDTSDVFTVTFDSDGDITGTDASETIAGDSGDNVIDGGGGDDIILGGTGDDTITGGDGNDIIYGGEGDDTIAGESGDDIISGGDGTDDITTGTGADIVTETEVNDGEVTDFDSSSDVAVSDSDMSSLLDDAGQSV